MPPEPGTRRVVAFVDGQNLFHAARRTFGHNHRNYDVGKLSVMGRQGVHVCARPLRYRTIRMRLPDGTMRSFVAGEEKGIDVRIALDVVRMAHRAEYDVALIFSQDQYLSEVAQEIRSISREQNRWIKIACAFPHAPNTTARRGIDMTDWIRIDRATYDACLDHRDYRPKARSRTFHRPGRRKLPHCRAWRS